MFSDIDRNEDYPIESMHINLQGYTRWVGISSRPELI